MKRQNIFISELISINWILRFKWQPASDEFWYLRFSSDRTVFSSMTGQLLVWRPVCSGSFQIELYPVITSSRTEDGSWKMENLNVIITQAGPMSSDCSIVDVV